MNNTILSKKDLEILEKILSTHGSIIDYDSIQELLKKSYSQKEIRKKVSSLSIKGWLVRIKRKLYAVASLESHKFTNISPIAISAVLIPESYVSMEVALNYHGLFDQLPNRVTAINTKKSIRYNFQSIEYKFVKTKPEIFFGFKEFSMEGQRVKIAETEKAILDFMYFRSDAYTIDLVLERLKTGREDIDFDKLINYVMAFPVSIKRKLGFLLDLVGKDASKIHDEVNNLRNFNRLTKNSNIFNAKWRLYYEDRFTK